MNAPAQRSADGRLLPGNTVGIAGARPRNIVTELKIRYENRIPELLEGLFLLTKSDSPHVRIAATRELLDRLIGKPQVTIDAVTTKVDVASLYLAAMKRANASAPVIDEQSDPRSDQPREAAKVVEMAPDGSPTLPGDGTEIKLKFMP